MKVLGMELYVQQGRSMVVFREGRGCMDKCLLKGRCVKKCLANRKDVFWVIVDLKPTYDALRFKSSRC